LHYTNRDLHYEKNTHTISKGWTAACGAAGYFLSSSFLQKHNRAMEYNKIGEASSWSDPDGKQYSVTPTRTFAGPSDIPCRDFRQTVEINGQTEVLTGSACRQSDGTWKLNS